jgi:hypothetical protein
VIRNVPLLLALLTLTATFPSGACADFYRYTDGSGAVNITNSLDSVPKKYRSTMKVVREDPAPKKAAVPETAQEPVSVTPVSQTVAPANAAARLDELSGRFPWLKPLLYLAAIVALWAVIIKVTSLLPSRLLGRVIYVAFAVGVVTFLYKSYAEHVVETTHKLKEDAAAVAQKAAERQDALRREAEGPGH